jgi:hypothetical protein
MVKLVNNWQKKNLKKQPKGKNSEDLKSNGRAGASLSGFLPIYINQLKKQKGLIPLETFFKIGAFKIQYMAALKAGKINKTLLSKQFVSPTLRFQTMENAAT